MRERPHLESPEGDPLSSPACGRGPGGRAPCCAWHRARSRLDGVTPAPFSDKEMGGGLEVLDATPGPAVSLGRVLGLPCLLLQSGV